MSVVEDVVSELEGIGVIGNKVSVLKLKPVREAEPEPEYEPPPLAEDELEEQESAQDEPSEEEPEDPVLSEAQQLRERLMDLSLKADEKLAAVIEAVQDLRGVFQELHEATRGEHHEEISDEAGAVPRHPSGSRKAEAGPDSGG